MTKAPNATSFSDLMCPVIIGDLFVYESKYKTGLCTYKCIFYFNGHANCQQFVFPCLLDFTNPEITSRVKLSRYF